MLKVRYRSCISLLAKAGRLCRSTSIKVFQSVFFFVFCVSLRSVSLPAQFSPSLLAQVSRLGRSDFPFEITLARAIANNRHAASTVKRFLHTIRIRAWIYARVCNCNSQRAGSLWWRRCDGGVCASSTRGALMLSICRINRGQSRSGKRIEREPIECRLLIARAPVVIYVIEKNRSLARSRSG